MDPSAGGRSERRVPPSLHFASCPGRRPGRVGEAVPGCLLPVVGMACLGATSLSCSSA